jgi:hypothetical protein
VLKKIKQEGCKKKKNYLCYFSKLPGEKYARFPQKHRFFCKTGQGFGKMELKECDGI